MLIHTENATHSLDQRHLSKWQAEVNEEDLHGFTGAEIKR